ncbi:MAG: hypothetical protein V7646_2161 [Pseudonocardia sp.]
MPLTPSTEPLTPDDPRRLDDDEGDARVTFGDLRSPLGHPRSKQCGGERCQRLAKTDPQAAREG